MKHESVTGSRPVASPRIWQTAALDIWSKEMRGIVRVVTGGGKTIFAHLCVAKFREQHPHGRVLIVVPTTALLDQWIISLEEDAGIRPDAIASYSGEEKPARPALTNVLVINTARSLVDALSSQVPTMLIVDECHRAGSPENARALIGTFAATLGLSATPEREYDDGFESHIVPTLGPIIFAYDYTDAARDGIISPFALHNVRIPLQPEEQHVYSRLSRRIAMEHRRASTDAESHDALIRLLRRRAAATINAAMRIPVAVKIAERHLGSRTLIFHERVAAAEAIAKILSARRRSVTVYHTQVAAPLRRDNLRLYRRGTFDILVCCRALDEGINVPETSLAIVAASTSSGRQRIQRLGRVLRPARGKELADVYTLYATPLEERRLLEESRKLGETCAVSWTEARR